MKVMEMVVQWRYITKSKSYYGTYVAHKTNITLWTQSKQWKEINWSVTVFDTETYFVNIDLAIAFN